MAASAVQSAAAWLGKLVVEEAKYLYDVKEKVEDLQVKLELMQCFLSDADKRQNEDAVIRQWVSQIRDLAYDAEDIVWKYIHSVSNEDRHQDLWTRFLSLLCLCWDVCALHEIGTDVDGLRRKVLELTSTLQTYGVKTIREEISASPTDAITLELRRTYAHLKDDMIVGIDNDIASLAGQLVADRGRKVVVISGMGGLGKTTLAREVYHHPDVRRHFSGFAWAHISQQFQTRNVIIGILLELIPEKDMDRRNRIQGLQDAQLHGELFQVLQEKSYLVVLDDMWTAEDWLRLRAAFPVADRSTGSKILVTTRNSVILSSLGNKVLKHEPDFLDDDNSLKLLLGKAMTTTEGDAGAPDSDMIRLGKTMLEHCQGLPLAIVVLRAVLVTKKTPEEWQTVNDNIYSYFGRGKAQSQSYSQVYSVLAMSYYNLPYYIKPCFLHLGNFPEDYEIPTKKLYRMWIAEGIVASSSERTLEQSSLEEKAEYCLNELIQKCMVQVGKVGSKGKIKTCRLHDLIRDICLEIGKEENFICVLNLNQTNQDDPPLVLNEKFRRLAIYVGEKADASLPDSLSKKAHNIRSLLFFPNEEQEPENCSRMRSVCNNFRLLRVLDLNGFNIEGSLPKEIGNLIYLRFLSLNETMFSEIPLSIAYLSCLETLDLRVIHVEVMIPNVLWKLRRLKHLYLPSNQNYKIKMGQMMRLDGLQYLETLKNVDIDRVESKGLNELRNMRKLKMLCVSKKENLDPFIKSSSIERLSLTIDGFIVSENPMILSSCQPLHYLSIKNRIHGLLRPEMFPKNLVNIELFGCEVENDPMPVFERLSQLKTLRLRKCYGGKEMVCSPGGFPELTQLNISNLSELREWKVGAGALPNLKSIWILSSPNLVLPDVLPSDVKIFCNPCVKGIEKYKRRCSHYLEQSE